jgi:hypothetical protein
MQVNHHRVGKLGPRMRAICEARENRDGIAYRRAVLRQILLQPRSPGFWRRLWRRLFA